MFSDSSDNSYIIEKESMISWNYHRLTPEYGQGQAKELHSLLKDVFRNLEIEINNRKGCLEVKSKADPKDFIQTKIIKKMNSQKPIDFIFTFGNETRYSSIFQMMNSKKHITKL